MALETVRIVCQPNVYTLVADSKTYAGAVIPNGMGRAVIKATQPTPDETAYLSFGPDGVSFGHGLLAGTEKVWIMPIASAAVTVEVIRS